MVDKLVLSLRSGGDTLTCGLKKVRRKIKKRNTKKYIHRYIVHSASGVLSYCAM